MGFLSETPGVCETNVSFIEAWFGRPSASINCDSLSTVVCVLYGMRFRGNAFFIDQ